MTGFEPPIPGIGSNCSTNRVTTTAPFLFNCFCFSLFIHQSFFLLYAGLSDVSNLTNGEAIWFACAVWPDWAQFHLFGEIVKVLNIFWDFSIWQNIQPTLTHFVYAIGQVFIAENGQMLNNSIAVWSHCLHVHSIALITCSHLSNLSNTNLPVRKRSNG